MQVASMLSNGYLQPSLSSPAAPSRTDQKSPKAQDGAAASLAMREAQILAQEQALKTQTGSGAQVSTTYQYSIGPDGRRYITAAEVKIEGDEQAVDRVGGGVKKLTGKVRNETGAAGDSKQASEPQPEDGRASGDPASGAKNSSELSEEEKQAVQELRQIEQEVVTHEAAHMAVGGRFAGSVSYSTTQGPDGRSYITGGEVPISVPASSNPEETLHNMEQVRRAALAPANPSGQDLGVAAQAAAAAAQARQELSTASANAAGGESSNGSNGDRSVEAGALKSGASSVQAGLRFRQIWTDRDEFVSGRTEGRGDFSSENSSSGDPSDSSDPVSLLRNGPRDAYALYASSQGLWAMERGFEQDPAKQARGKSLPDFAA